LSFSGSTAGGVLGVVGTEFDFFSFEPVELPFSEPFFLKKEKTK